MKNQNNLDTLSKKLYKFIAISFIIITAIFLSLWWVAEAQSKNSELKIARSEARNAIKLYNANLSEKLSLISNTSDFFQYINSGPETRKDLFYNFFSQLSGLESEEIIGMSLHTDKGKLIYEHGEKSKDFIEVKLCYLNGYLDNSLGDCLHTWKIFFNKDLAKKKLMYLNPHLKPCANKECIDGIFFQQGRLGSFTVNTSSKTILKFSIKKNNTYLDSIILIFILAIIVLGTVIYLLIKTIVGKELKDPLSAIVSALKANKNINTNIYLDEINYLSVQILKSLENKKLIERAKLSEQIAHDIRSPITALEMAISSNNIDKSERESIISSSIIQIRRIADQLLSEKNKKTRKSIVVIYKIIKQSLMEKNVELLKTNSRINLILEADDTAKQAEANIEESTLKTVLSNLLNNAIEASYHDENSFIKLNLFKKQNTIVIQIQDNGIGIEREDQHKIFEKGFSNKEKGRGLGLHHAKQKLHILGGDVSLCCKNNLTSIEILLPKAPTAQIPTLN